jgi:hypothetical protein
MMIRFMLLCFGGPRDLGHNAIRWFKKQEWIDCKRTTTDLSVGESLAVAVAVGALPSMEDRAKRARGSVGASYIEQRKRDVAQAGGIRHASTLRP